MPRIYRNKLKYIVSKNIFLCMRRQIFHNYQLSRTFYAENFQEKYKHIKYLKSIKSINSATAITDHQ